MAASPVKETQIPLVWGIQTSRRVFTHLKNITSNTGLGWFFSSSLVPANLALLSFSLCLAERAANECIIWESPRAQLIKQLLGSGFLLCIFLYTPLSFGTGCDVCSTRQSLPISCEEDERGFRSYPSNWPNISDTQSKKTDRFRNNDTPML